MSLEHLLPRRPLRFAETMRDGVIDGVDFVTPLFATIDRSVARGEDVVVGCIILDEHRGELAGYDPTSKTWGAVASYPDINDVSGVHAGLDRLDSWLYERYAPGRLVPITLDLEALI